SLLFMDQASKRARGKQHRGGSSILEEVAPRNKQARAGGAGTWRAMFLPPEGDNHTLPGRGPIASVFFLFF
ncbi:MAG TPA: hypothetical protein VFW87_07510, partial [Pirellulales bacterium]|nr:hypothetical protein [Pirellulales bacterium]